MNSFFERRYVVAGIFIAFILVLLGRLFYIQVVDDRYALYASQNVIRKIIQYPARGPILDRHGKIMVQSDFIYDIMVIPKQVKPFDTVEFCKLLGIDKAGYDKRIIKARKYSPYRASVFEKQLSPQLYATFQERLSEFPGFFPQQRPVRAYPDSAAAQFLGYIGEATDAIIKRSGGYYSPGDYVGITGVEKSYETLLRGQRGVQTQMVDSRNANKGRYANGAFDTSAIAGDRLVSSLDMTIQKLGESLMRNKVGSIVAIEPSSGEILAFVSSPTYDPNLLVGKERGNNAAKLYKDPYKPFFTRPVQALYPPGSSFKPLSALIALQEGLLKPSDTYNCIGYYMAGNHRVKCTHVHGNVNLAGAIAGSCNGYFNMVFAKVLNQKGGKQTAASYTDWKADVNKLGFGVRLGVDVPAEGRGLVPSAKYYDKIYRPGGWRSTTVASLAIGQGELLATPLQLANIEATIANRGYYYKPHLIKAIGDKQVIKHEFTVKNYVGIDSQYFEPVINGMQSVVDYGTAHDSKVPGIIMCGKTGTVQNRGAKNHSVFVAFAPRDNPKIAICVVVENSGDGGTWAAPIASFIVEKYLRDTITRRPSGITTEYYRDAYLLPPIVLTASEKRKLRADSVKKAQADSVSKLKLKSASAPPSKKEPIANRSTAMLPKRKDNE